jgi:hypothetical protein
MNFIRTTELHLMGIPSSEVGYTSATTGRGDHEVHKGHGGDGKKKKHFG